MEEGIPFHLLAVFADHGEQGNDCGGGWQPAGPGLSQITAAMQQLRVLAPG